LFDEREFHIEILLPSAFAVPPTVGGEPGEVRQRICADRRGERGQVQERSLAARWIGYHVMELRERLVVGREPTLADEIARLSHFLDETTPSLALGFDEVADVRLRQIEIGVVDGPNLKVSPATIAT